MKPIVELDLKQPEIPCDARHQLVLGAWKSLKPGNSFRFETDHDPLPLLKQLEGLRDSALTLDYELKGPQVFRILVTRKEERRTCCE